VEFAVLRDMGQAKRKVRTPKFRRTKFLLFNDLVNRTPRKLPSGTREQNSVGRSSRMLSIEHKRSHSEGVRNQERKARDWPG